MKKLLCLLLPALLVSFASCKDDNPPSTPDYAAQVTGEYTGWFDIYAEEDDVWEELPDAQQANGFYLSRTSNSRVSLVIDELNFVDTTVEPAEQVDLRNIIISNIKVTKNGTTYNIAARNAAVTMSSEGAVAYNNGVATLSGVIDPTVGGESSATIELKLRNTRGGEVLASKPIKIEFDTLIDELP